MNTDLLKQLYGVYSPSRNTKRMRKFLKRQIILRGGRVEQDKAGNLLVTKGVAEEYPCLASHYDQVSHHTHPKDFRCIETNGIIMGWSDKLLQQCGLGADDKNGIFICLNALEKCDVIKVAFFVDEEIGCQGSSAVDLKFFDDVRFVIEPDRMHGTDFITSMSGMQVCSDDFIKDCDYADFGYKEEMGSVTDVLTLLENGLKVSCLNLSCGYYHPHTDQEVTVLSELENCQNMVFHIVETMQKKYPFVYADPWTDYAGNGNYFGSRNIFGGAYWEDADYDMMDYILCDNDDITFDEVVDGWGMSFHTQDLTRLEEIYNDVKSCYGMEIEDYSGNDDDEDSFPNDPLAFAKSEN